MKLNPFWIPDNTTNLLQVRIREIAFQVNVKLLIGLGHSAESIEQVEFQAGTGVRCEKFG